MLRASLLLALLLAAVPAHAEAIPQQTPIPITWFETGEEGIPAPPPQAVDAETLLPPEARPMIAIVIDDMGVDIKRSARALELPPEITVSYLPYAPKIAAQAAAAKAKGHEVILHMPMEAENPREDPGPHHLAVGMKAEEIRAAAAAALDTFGGYDGVNNHMGSKFTSAKPGMEVFMAEVKKRGLFFLDSRTAPTSVAEEVARAAGVPATHRDVFLDHDEDAAHVAAALRHAEAVARKYGAAVAIGHPKDVTLAALRDWLKTAEESGMDIVPLSSVVALRARGN